MRIYGMSFALFSIFLISAAGTASAAFTYNNTINGSELTGAISDDRFVEPSSLFYENGTLYAADSFKSRIMVMQGSRMAKTIGGRSGDFHTLGRPRAIFVENGEVFIADTNNGRGKVYKGTPVLLALGSETSLEANSPQGVFAYGTLVYLVNTGDHKIRLYDRSSLRYLSDFGAEGVGNDRFERPTDMFIYGGRVYIADTGNDRVQVLSMNLSYLDTIGRGKGGVALSRPEGVYVSSDRVYVADTGNHRIAVFTLAGDPIETLGGRGNGKYEFDNPRDVFAGDGKLYVADTYNARVQVYLINDTADQALLEGLADAGARVRSYEELAAAAAKVDVRSQSDARTYLDIAQEDMVAHRYIDAEAHIAKANSSAAASITAVESALDYRLRAMARLSRERLGELPYTAGAEERVRVGGMISEVEEKIYNKSYAAAVEKMLLVESELAKLGAGAGAVKNETGSEGEQRLALEERGRKVGEQLKAVEGLAGNYNMSIDRSEVDALLRDAGAKMGEGDLGLAAAMMGYAEKKANELIAGFEEKLSNMEKANEAIGEAEREITNVEGAWSGSLIRPNLAGAKKSLADARGKLYSEPENALELARQAKATAVSESKRASELQGWLVKGGAAAILTVAGALAIAAVAIIFVMRRRRGL